MLINNYHCLDLKCPLKIHVINKGLVTSLPVLLGGSETFRGRALLEEVSHCGCALEYYIDSHSPQFPGYHEVSSSHPSCPATMMYRLTIGPEITEPSKHGLKLLKP
jgi:hypothetical protein